MKRTNVIFRILAIVLILASLGMVALPWYNYHADFYTESVPYSTVIVSFVESIGDNGVDFIAESAPRMLLAIATVLLVITAVLAIVLAACGVRGGGIPFFAASLLCLGCFIYNMSLTNSEAYSYLGKNVVSLGIGAILCPVFALIAMILLFIPDNTARPVRRRQ